MPVNVPGPIWVLDPTGNNNPFLKVKGAHTVFVTYTFAVFINGSQTSNSELFYSTNGVAWAAANNPVSGFRELKDPTQILYENGMFMIKFSFTYSVVGMDHFAKDVVVQSTNGQDWTIALEANENDSVTVNVAWSSINNRWTLTNGATTVIVNNPNPPNTLFGDFLTPVPSANSDLFNDLPNGYTAVRVNDNVSVCASIDLTTTPITDAIRNSGPSWPAAAWVSVFSQNPTCEGGSSIGPFYGQVGA